MTSWIRMNEDHFDKMVINLHRAMRVAAKSVKSSYEFLQLFRSYEAIWMKRCKEIGVTYSWNDPDRFRKHAFEYARINPNTYYSMTLKGVKNLLVQHG